MSNPLRVAAAVEGPTDVIVLRAALEAVLADTEFEFHTVQPEGSVAFGATARATTGARWVGISDGWPTVAANLTEAGRFHGELLVAIDGIR